MPDPGSTCHSGPPQERWKARDSLLVAFAMYIDLNDTTGERELANAAIRAALPEELFPVLFPLGSEWDAPVDGGTWRAPPLPGAAVLNLRQGQARVAHPRSHPSPSAWEMWRSVATDGRWPER